MVHTTPSTGRGVSAGHSFLSSGPALSAKAFASETSRLMSGPVELTRMSSYKREEDVAIFDAIVLGALVNNYHGNLRG